MSQPVKLSDELVLDARMVGQAVDRSIAGQVEFWAKLGRAIEPLLQGAQAIRLCRDGGRVPLAELLDSVDSPAGRDRLADHLAELPFPHYAPHPRLAGMLIRTDADGKRTTGRFVNRVFTPSRAGPPRK